MKKILIIITITIITITVLFFVNKKLATNSNNTVTKIGRIYLFGTGELPQLGLEVDNDQKYCLSGPLIKELQEKYQNQTLILEGKFTKELCTGREDGEGTIKVSSYKIK